MKSQQEYMKNVSTIYLFSQFQLNFPSMSFSSDFRMLIPQQNSTTPVRPAESINTKTEVFLCENSVFVKTITYKKNTPLYNFINDIPDNELAVSRH